MTWTWPRNWLLDLIGSLDELFGVDYLDNGASRTGCFGPSSILNKLLLVDIVLEFSEALTQSDKKSSPQINKLEINPPQKKRITPAMIKKLSKMNNLQIIIIFAILERIKGATEIELILSRLNKIENTQKLIIGTIRKQRGQIQQLDAALQIKQVNITCSFLHRIHS